MLIVVKNNFDLIVGLLLSLLFLVSIVFPSQWFSFLGRVKSPRFIVSIFLLILVSVFLHITGVYDITSTTLLILLLIFQLFIVLEDTVYISMFAAFVLILATFFVLIGQDSIAQIFATLFVAKIFIVLVKKYYEEV